MKKVSVALVGLLLSGMAHAIPMTLNFNKSGFMNTSSLSKGGFTLSVLSSGNYFSSQGLGALNFHNGLGNTVYDNNLTLSYGGAPFDLVDIDIAGFTNTGATLDLLGSDGSTFSSDDTGTQTVDFQDVTSVTFSISDGSAASGAGLNSLTVNPQSTATPVPEPTSIALLGLGLLGLGWARRKCSG